MIDSLYGFLSSLGFSEPLHSPITHMPIGLVVGALVFLLVAIIFRKDILVLSARHVSILALVFAFPTILLGVLDWLHFYHGIFMPAIKIKMALAASVLVLLGLGLILGGKTRLGRIGKLAIYTLSFVAVMGLGWFGSSIIYGRSTGTEASSKLSSSSLAAGAEGRGDSSRGLALFESNCRSCHANGGNAIEASLPLKSSRKLASSASLLAFVRFPAMPDGSVGEMPAFGANALSEAQVSDLYAYVSGAWK